MDYFLEHLPHPTLPNSLGHTPGGKPDSMRLQSLSLHNLDLTRIILSSRLGAITHGAVQNLPRGCSLKVLGALPTPSRRGRLREVNLSTQPSHKVWNCLFYFFGLFFFFPKDAEKISPWVGFIFLPV